MRENDIDSRDIKMSDTYRFSDMSVEQLQKEAAKFKEKAQRAEQHGNPSEMAINERKMQVALAYTLNPDDFESEEVYEVRGDPGHTFKINYINGVFAWGQRINLLGEHYESEEALPISLLGQKKQQK